MTPLAPGAGELVGALRESADGVLVCTTGGRILDLNRAAAAMCGRRPDELRGRTLASMLGGDGVQVLRPAIEAATRGTSTGTLVLEQRALDGTTRALEISVSPMLDAREPMNLFLCLRDRTPDVRAIHDWEHLEALDELLSGSRNQPEAIAQAVAEWMAQVFDCGAAVWVLHGELLFPLGIAGDPSNTQVAIDPGRAASAPIPLGEDLIGQVVATGEAVHFTDIDSTMMQSRELARYRRAVRELGIRSAAILPCKAIDGQAGAIAVFSDRPSAWRDPSEVARLQRLADRVGLVLENAHQVSRLRTRRAELQRLNTDLRQYAHLVSHDLQEPIRTTGAMASLVARRYGDQLDEQGREWLTLITDGAERMRKMVTEVLRFVESDSELKLELVDTAALVAEVARDHAVSIEDASADLEILPLPTVRADRVQLGRVFTNLLSNALRNGRPDVPLRIGIRALSEGSSWRFEVEDNGKGFDPALADRIFAMHYRGSGGNTGVGLAIVQTIVQRHGGWVEATSEPGVHTVFSFTLPQEDLPFEDTQEVALTRQFRPSQFPKQW